MKLNRRWDAVTYTSENKKLKVFLVLQRHRHYTCNMYIIINCAILSGIAIEITPYVCVCVYCAVHACVHVTELLSWFIGLFNGFVRRNVWHFFAFVCVGVCLDFLLFFLCVWKGTCCAPSRLRLTTNVFVCFRLLFVRKYA